MLAQSSKPQALSNNQDTDWGQLWTETRNGNSESLAKIFCSTYAVLFNYGYKIAQDEGLIKDCIQELFLNLWYKKKTVSHAHSVKSYLISSLRRIILLKLTKQRNSEKREYDYTIDSFTEVFNTEELLIHFETESYKKQMLVEALRSLSNRQKEVIYLKFFNGLSNDEISEVMDVNKQSVYNHVSKAIQKMQDFINVNDAIIDK